MLQSVLFLRLTTVTVPAALLIAAQMLGWVTYAEAVEPPPTSGTLPAAPPNSLPIVRRALREFDRFLDHHPLIEDNLRRNPRLVTSADFLEKNPALRDFLRAFPGVAEGLQVYPRYFLNRALLRQASAPLAFPGFAPLRELFQQEPKLERELNENPERIRDSAYLDARPSLRRVLVENPALARVFLPSQKTVPPK